MAMASPSNTTISTIDEEPPKDRTELRFLPSIVVQSRLGQIGLRLVNNFLWIVEKCAEWGLPRHEIGEDENRKDSGKPELVRPLPWLLFLPSLVFLRVIRVTMNIGAFVLGYPTITQSKMVKFVQICRRYLDSATNKEKENYEIKDNRPSVNEAKKALIRSIRLTLSSLSCLDASKPSLSPPPTKIHVSNILNPDPITIVTEKKSVTDSADAAEKLTSESEEEEKQETLQEKLDQLALETSDFDEDFDPTNYCSSLETNDDDDDDENSNVSATEVRDIIEDATSNKDPKNINEQFVHAEQASALAPQQESELVCGKRSSSKESRDKVEERLATSQRIDTPECYTPDRSSQEGDPTFYSPISSDSDAPKDVSASPVAEQCTARKILKTNEFINGEARFISASTISESKSSGETNNGTVVQKRSINMSKYHKGKRMSHGNRKKK